MRTFSGTSVLIRTMLIAATLFSGFVRPQETKAPAMLVTTQERLETSTWWPTMGTAPLKAYAGSASCTGCHADQNSRSATGMQLAAMPGVGSHVLPTSVSASFVSGSLTYSLTAGKTALRLSASAGAHTAVQPVDWVFGAGDLAHTFLYKTDGRWFQSEASFYTRGAALDITTGFGRSASKSSEAALGNVLSPADARACFGCHTVHATTSAGLNPLHAEAGVGCEACHGPGQQHVESMSSGGTSEVTTTIFQPAKLSPSDSIDFCGACHRSFADASLSVGPQADRAAVRFQPYRLEESKCWRATQDQRLTCVACHDPHQPLNRNVASYDANCLRCHTGKASVGEQHIAAVCPRATHDCVTCHMPKVNLPSMHGDFTDHLIRVVKE